jgi:SM-20-related protein
MMDLTPVVQDLKQKGWHLSQNLVPTIICEGLLNQLLFHQKENDLKKAHIGQGVEKQIQQEIRGDSICWLDFKNPSEAEKKFAEWLEVFLAELRPQLLWGLSDFEFHYAFYPPQAGYQKHVDVFKKNSLRKISFVLYLNKNWATQDGGEIVLFDEQDNNKEAAKISPHFGHLVLFLSDTIYHQVNFTNRARYSVTGWLKNRY